MTKSVFVVTPCMNGGETIDRTILSVVSQAGDVRIRYHIQDGGSTDDTLHKLAEWKQRLDDKSFPIQCHSVRFSYSSEPDTGMYDALVRAFDKVDAPSEGFMTWINADDILMPGAAALASALGRQFTPSQLSWFGGAVNIIREDITTINFDRPIPTMGLRAGVCDGLHWDVLQQEGTFFRRWLWNSIDPRNTIAPMKLAGDWNLWRLMAHKASLVQTHMPLGGFRISDAQLSARLRDKYMAEIDALIPEDKRRDAFEKLCAAEPVLRRKIKANEGSRFVIIEETKDSFAKYRFAEVFGRNAPWGARKPLADRVHAMGKKIDYAAVDHLVPEFPDITPLVAQGPGWIALDADWQFPAITEKHAFHRMRESLGTAPSNVLYVAYPWATLIDKMANKAADKELHYDRFEQFCARLPKDVPKVTVCQHIHGRVFLDLFRKAGISDVFWTHATHDDVEELQAEDTDPRLRPFPLYPVQVVDALPEAGKSFDDQKRPHLFSFIGARANQYYLTEARNWVLDLLADDTRGLVVGRDSWHYQKVVYDLQVRGTGAGDATGLEDQSAADQFRAQLLNTTFSLCPAGSGPNSIRLWESMGAGAIPVILADTWAPPGDPRLWEMGAVFCKETPEDIKALPDRLAEIAADPVRLAQMRHAMRQLWILYGPQGFVTDVQSLMLTQAQSETSQTAPETDDFLGNMVQYLDRVAPEKTYALLLRTCASALLLHPQQTLQRLSADEQLGQDIQAARTSLEAGSTLGTHFDAVLEHARKIAAKKPMATPVISTGAVAKVHAMGRHANRTPLSYDPIRNLVADRLDWVSQADEADVILTGFNIDLKEGVKTLAPLMDKANAPQIVVMSEEPLWDITWSGPFTGRNGLVTAEGVEIPYHFFGHETSDIYDFDKLPYFILSNVDYAVRYSALMSRFKNMTAKSLLERWERAPIRSAFFAEKRKGDNYGKIFADRDVAGLSSYRTEIAELSTGDDVLRVGKGWGAEVRRQDLPDWHLDKLAQLDGQVRVATAYENVHQYAYISEKIFDSFAVGGIPTYWASPKHRVFDLVSGEAMLNTRDLDAAEAAAKIATFNPDLAMAEAWLASCTQLAALFSDINAVQAERQRVANAALKEILSVV